MIVRIESSYIKLDSFLKMINAVSSGGEAKIIIAEGAVSVNGAVEIRRGRKLYAGDRVEFGTNKFLLESAELK